MIKIPLYGYPEMNKERMKSKIKLRIWLMIMWKKLL
jgi:hypothetical protein